MQAADTSSRFNALQDDCSQARSHVPGASSMWNAPHVQQSSTTTQSPSVVHVVEDVPVSLPESAEPESAEPDPADAVPDSSVAEPVEAVVLALDADTSVLALSSSSATLVAFPSSSAGHAAKKAIRQVDRMCNGMIDMVDLFPRDVGSAR